MARASREEDDDGRALPACRSLESVSLGGIALTARPLELPKKYRSAKDGERSTYQGAGVVPVCRMGDGTIRALLWQPQFGAKKGVRWWDFGGKKVNKDEFTSCCACRKFAKQTYGLFGCEIDISGTDAEKVDQHLAELYQGLSNLPLMLRASQDWAAMQLLDGDAKVFYNDQHEYHIYLMNVPFVPAEILGKVSGIVDGGKRVFKWLTLQDFADETLAPRLHTESLAGQISGLEMDPWVRKSEKYGEKHTRSATGAFSATVVPGCS